VELDDRGAVLAVLDRKPEVRRIKIKSLSADKNMAQLAADIVDKCKYIHPSRTEEIEQLLLKLRKHFQSTAASTSATAQNNANDDDNDRRAAPQRSESRGRSAREQSSSNNNVNNNHHDRRGGGYNDEPREQHARVAKKPVDNLPPADMNELDDYLEMLYQVSGKSEREKEDGLRAQERGTAMILKLCRDVMNLEQLIQNSTVMGAVTRVLQEEYKKSIDLTFNILR
jgi:hypothetical protein